MGSNKVCSIGLDNHTSHFDRAQMDRVCSGWSTLIEPAGHRTVRSCSKWRVLTKPAGSRVGCVCSRVKRKTQKTLTEPTWHRFYLPCSRAPRLFWRQEDLTESTGQRVIRTCSRALRLSTRCVAQTRWEEHIEPTWHRLDRVCSREQDLDFVASLYTSMLDSPYRGVKSLSLLTPWADQPYGGRVESR